MVAQHKWWKGCIVYACVKGMFSVWEGYGVGALDIVQSVLIRFSCKRSKYSNRAIMTSPGL